MKKAWVYAVFPSLQVSWKIAAAVDAVGTMDQDRTTAISGRLGEVPRMIPVEVRLRSARAGERAFRFRMVDDELFTPLLGYVSLLSVLQGHERAFGAATLRLDARLSLAGGREVHFEDVVASEQPAQRAAAVVAGPLALLAGNDFEQVAVDELVLTVDAVESREAATLVRAWVDAPLPLRPGSVVPVKVQLRTRRGETLVETLSLEVPASALGGSYTLLVADAQTMDEVAGLGANVIVGSPFETVGADSYAGRVYLFAPDGTLLHTFVSPNSETTGEFGSSVAAFGADVLVGAPGENGNTGRAYLFAPSGTLLLTLNGTGGGRFGAAVGAVLGIFLSLNVILIQSLAFAFGLGAVALVYLTANAVRGHDPLLVLVLAGVVVGALLGACVALMKYLADPYNQLPAITFWLLGSIASTAPEDVWSTLPLMLLGLVPMWLLRWRINLLALDDEEARALGVETGRIRLVAIAAATLMTSASVAISGVIGWIGLVIPHFARMLVGPDFSRLLPTSVVLGAAFLLAVDTLARTVARIEIPLGVLTAFVGTPLFLWQLATARRGWQ